MAEYRKKPIAVDATQWFKNGDHPADDCEVVNEVAVTEGDVVRYYRDPEDHGGRRCESCGRNMHDHGWIDTREGGHAVCPGDFIITDVRVAKDHHGHFYPCKPDIFEATYDLVE